MTNFKSLRTELAQEKKLRIDTENMLNEITSKVEEL